MTRVGELGSVVYNRDMPAIGRSVPIRRSPASRLWRAGILLMIITLMLVLLSGASAHPSAARAQPNYVCGYFQTEYHYSGMSAYAYSVLVTCFGDRILGSAPGCGPVGGMGSGYVRIYDPILQPTVFDLSGGTVYLELTGCSSSQGIADCSQCDSLPTPPVAPAIDFRVDRDAIIRGECTTLRWDVENVRAVYLDGQGVVGHDSRVICPLQTTTYVLHVITDAGAADQAVNVLVFDPSPSAAPPTPIPTRTRPVSTAAPTDAPRPATPTPTRTPHLIATLTPSPPPAPLVGMVEGNVSDGHDHPLVGVEVVLLRGTDNQGTTKTDVNGDFGFGQVPAGPGYQVQVRLREEYGGVYRRQIKWGDDQLDVRAATRESFEVKPGQIEAVHIDFGAPAQLDSGEIPGDKLDDLASFYFHTQQVDQFAVGTLGMPETANWMPVEAILVYLGTPSVRELGYYCPAAGAPRCGQAYVIYIGAGVSDFESVNNHYYRPMNREWHENFHYLMDKLHSLPVRGAGDESHAGFSNSSSADSWAEGWAEFWPCVLWHVQGYPKPEIYRNSPLGIDIEQNWRSWDNTPGVYWQEGQLLPDLRVQHEELAVAALLWDLYDEKNVEDRGETASAVASLSAPWDNVDLSLSDLWGVIGTKKYDNVKSLYDGLLADIASLKNEDTTAIDKMDLDMLFVLHGFFADQQAACLLCAGRHEWEPGEDPGWAGKPDRSSWEPLPNAYVKVDVVDWRGKPIDGATMRVEISHDNPYFDYSSEWDLPQATGNLIYLELPDPETAASARFVAFRGSRSSDAYIVNNSEYWTRVQAATSGYAEEFTLVVAREWWTGLLLPSLLGGLLLVGAGTTGILWKRHRSRRHAAYLYDSQNPGRPVRLGRSAVSMGRDPGNTLVLAARGVSHRHAQVTPTSAGYRLTDVGSRNGTFVNGQPVKSHVLAPGDVIRLGEAEVVYQLGFARVSPSTPRPGAPVRGGFAPAPVPPGPGVPLPSSAAAMPTAPPPPPRAAFVPSPAPGTPVAAPPAYLVAGAVRYLIPPGGAEIGRDSHCAICLADPQVSRSHARLGWTAGSWVITDLGSVNGTYVNGIRVQSQILQAGDEVRVGVTRLCLSP